MASRLEDRLCLSHNHRRWANCETTVEQLTQYLSEEKKGKSYETTGGNHLD